MKYESIIEAIKHHAETQPNALAVCEMNKSVTYAQYWDGIAKTAAVLLEDVYKRQLQKLSNTANPVLLLVRLLQ